MTQPRVRVAGALVALAALLGLTACSPAEKPVSALRVVDGQPALVLAQCSVFTADRISVSTTDATPSESWTIDRGGATEVTAVTLLQPPSGWTVGEQSLVALKPDVEYALAASGRQNDAETVHFTLAEVTGLGPEQVLVGDGGSKRKAVTETAFRDRAKKVC
ncbi:hypothetical protein V6V47_08280 [Micromonospora sp. CPCC 205539]|uniref:hypothetical protein n=1 Tax=Micromonospora sp. CPCC 205539 TaxID=3122408 RepID=UPI002FF05C6E